MKRPLFVLLVPSLLALGGCSKRSVCGFADNGFDPMSAEWQAHKDVIPPSAQVCGHFKKPAGIETNTSKVLQIDFENDDNPWVTIVDHMEKLGYKRTHQEIGNPDSQTAQLVKGEDAIHVTTIRQKGRVRAVLRLGK